MNDVDLIPNDYRQLCRFRRIVLRYGVVLALLVLLVAGGRLWIDSRLRGEQNRIARLKDGERLLVEQQRRLESLTAERDDLQNRLAILDALRGGPPAQRMFPLVDSAINDAVWFQEWSFTRRSDVPSAQQGTKTGYFIVTDNRPQGTARPWEGVSRMEITGDVLSHTSLAAFVLRLLVQPEITDVHLVHTATRTYASGEVIRYQLAIELAEGPNRDL